MYYQKFLSDFDKKEFQKSKNDEKNNSIKVIETKEQKKQRLSSRSEYDKKRRQRETKDQREIRLQNQRKRNAYY
jgi:hypothetical protein